MDKARWQQIDLNQLEDMAFRLFESSLVHPNLPTIQAGLLLMQRSNIDSKFLNTQLVGAAFELGLHLDCSKWTVSPFERGLRKRLAWALLHGGSVVFVGPWATVFDIGRLTGLSVTLLRKILRRSTDMRKRRTPWKT